MHKPVYHCKAHCGCGWMSEGKLSETGLALAEHVQSTGHRGELHAICTPTVDAAQSPMARLAAQNTAVKVFRPGMKAGG